MEQAVRPLDSGIVRWQTADLLLDRSEVIVVDTVAVFPLNGPQRLEADYCVELGSTLVRLLVDAVRSSGLDARSGGVVDFLTLANQRALTSEQVFSFAYLTLSTALHELSADPTLGAATEAWAQVAQNMRRGMFDVLSAWARRAIDTPSSTAITDQLTTLHTRALFDVALFKECHRAERFEHWVSLMLMDIDNLSEINRAHGYGVGDRLLERMGVIMRTFFRHHDWVARYAEDGIAVLLPETAPADVLALAERVRTMIYERLAFRDHRTDQRESVTVSVAVVSARALQGEPIDSQLVLREAELAVARAKTSGRNRVEVIEIPPRLMSLDEAATTLKTDLKGVERLVANGKLDSVTAGPHVRLERAAVRRFAAQNP